MFKPFVRKFWNLQLIRMCSHEVLGNTVLVGNKRRDLRNQEQSYGLKAHVVPQNRKLYSSSASLSQKYELSSIIGASVKTVCPHPIQDIRVKTPTEPLHSTQTRVNHRACKAVNTWPIDISWLRKTFSCPSPLQFPLFSVTFWSEEWQIISMLFYPMWLLRNAMNFDHNLCIDRATVF